MATPKSQRIGIFIIMIVMVVGTIGSFVVMMLGTDNARRDQVANEKRAAEYQKKFEEYQTKLQAQADELSAKYYPTFSQYASRVGTFDRDGVHGVSGEDLVVGEGEQIGDDTKYNAYYIGWTPDGKVFDQSISDGKLRQPIGGSGLISGWTEGVRGMHVGGIREITIPSDKAYGEQGSRDASGRETIPPNTPIRFLVMAVPTPAEIDYPGLD